VLPPDDELRAALAVANGVPVPDDISAAFDTLPRAMSRADLVAALQPEQIQLPRFIDGWFAADTQAGLRALVAKLGK